MGSKSKKTDSETFNEGERALKKRKTNKANEINQKIKEETKKLNLKHVVEIIELGTIYGGFLVKELSFNTGIQRRNLQKYLDILKEKKLITIDKKTGRINSASKYFDSLEDSKYLTWKFAKDFLNLFNKKRFFTLASNNIDNPKKDNYEVNKTAINSKRDNQIENLSRNDEYLEKLFYEFSNRIGCYIIYLILINLNPDIIAQRIASGMSTKLIEQMILRNIELGVKWLMNNSKPSLLYKFTRMINDNYASTPFELNDKEEIIEIKFNKGFYDDMINSLSNAYPLMVRELDKSFEDYPFTNPKQLLDSKRKTVVLLKDHRKRVKKRQLINECNHELENSMGVLNGRDVTQSILESEPDIDLTKIRKPPRKTKYQVCKKCHLRISNSEVNDNRILRKRKLKS